MYHCQYTSRFSCDFAAHHVCRYFSFSSCHGNDQHPNVLTCGLLRKSYNRLKLVIVHIPYMVTLSIRYTFTINMHITSKLAIY